MANRMKLMADFDCWPLWDIDDPENIDPATLNLSDNLVAELLAWAHVYDGTLDRTTGEVNFASEENERVFNEAGKKLFEKLKEALPETEIFHFDQKKKTLVE